GTFEEYHSTPSRSLFVMDADGDAVRPLTHTIIFDNEPEILADGRILFIRSDNFFDRGKVETLLHAIRPDGTEGHTEFGLEHGPEYGGRLRAHYCGSPAPMPDGRLAFLTDQGIAIGRIGDSRGNLQHLRVAAGDVAALPDGRLLCTLASKDSNYETIAILDTRSQGPTLTVLYESTDGPLHSPVYLGRRSRPPVLPERVEQFGDENARSTGFLFCQNARSTQNTTAGWSHVRAIRVLAAKGLTTRSSHSYIVHAGSEVTELGTVPLAPDGSFWIEVPADTPLALQAVDAEGRSELNEMSWIYVRPGERRGCAGCHQKRHVAPSSSAAMALRLAPLKLLGQGRPHRFRGNNAAVTGLMELQFDRYREVAGINRHADTADPLSTGAHEVADLVALLRGDDDKLAISAAQRLSIFRARSAAPALAACLRRPNRELRVAAAMALATCGSRETVPPLLETLTDRDPLVAQAAAVALENLTGHAESSNAYSTTTQGVPHDWKKRHHDRAYGIDMLYRVNRNPAQSFCGRIT
ncbi:MAG: HEAT repeat domain-containing protein, partial [Pirellulales bacterium]